MDILNQFTKYTKFDNNRSVHGGYEFVLPVRYNPIELVGNKNILICRSWIIWSSHRCSRFENEQERRYKKDTEHNR